MDAAGEGGRTERNMKRISIGTILAACLLALALAGCGSGQSVDANTLKGFWVLEDSAEVGFSAALSLEENDLAELMVADSYIEGTWKTDGSKATITFEDEGSKAANVFVSGDKLTLGKSDGSKLVFVKGNMESYFADQDDGSNAAVLAGSEGSEEMAIVDEVINDITPVKVVDDDTVKVEVTGKGTDFTADPGYRLAVTNKTGKAIYITADESFKVGDKAIEAGLGDVIEAGKTADVFLYFPKEDLGGGVEALSKVTGTITVGDDETGDEIKTYPFKMD